MVEGKVVAVKGVVEGKVVAEKGVVESKVVAGGWGGEKRGWWRVRWLPLDGEERKGGDGGEGGCR